jgi:S-adenosylmethionine/arginine decarboxylase-like enzyme
MIEDLETKWRNLAPNLIRQRVVIEGTTDKLVGPAKISSYLLKLAEVTDMEILQGPITGDAHELGFSGWVHWRTSGSHFYSYPANGTRKPLFTVDCYTCKPFSVKEAVEFTKKYFNAIEIVWKEIEV